MASQIRVHSAVIRFIYWIAAGLFFSLGHADTPPVISASELDYPPFSTVQEDGSAGGFSVELMQAALKAMNREVTYEVRPWAEIKQDLIDGRIEALPVVAHSPEREAVFDFTTPYLKMYGAVFVREEERGINTIEDLKLRRVGVMRSDIADEFMRREKLSEQLINTESYEEALLKLSRGELDAVVMQRLVGLNLIRDLKLDNLKTAVAPITTFRQEFSFAVTKGNESLLALLNEGLAIVMADGTYERLREKWLGILDVELVSLPAVREEKPLAFLGNKNIPPMIYVEDGKPEGLVIELTRALSERAGLTVDIQAMDWSLAQQRLQRGDADALLQINSNKEREKIYDFSKPLLASDFTIFRKSVRPDINNIASLYEGTVGVEKKGYPFQLLKKHPLINLRIIPSWESGFELIKHGEIDALIVDRWVGEYVLYTSGIKGISVVDDPVESSYSMIAVRKGNKALLDRINYGLDEILRDGTRSRILGKWRSKEIIYLSRERLYFYWALGGAAILVFILLVMSLFYMWRIKHINRFLNERTNALSREITHHQQTEAELTQEKERAETANRAKSLFLANMSHELRTPLNAVLGFSEMMSSDRRHNEQDKSNLAIINRSGRHLLQLINDVLDMSKIEAGKTQLETTDIDLESLILDVTDMMRVRAEQKGLQLLLDQASGFPRFVHADGPRIRQILINLLSNSIKFTDQGSVTIRLKAENEDPGHIILRGEVQDTGRGIDPEDVKRIFQPFEQLVSAIEQKGTGLGLAITRQFVELMDGKVSAAGQPGMGTTFYFFIKVAPGKADQIHPVEEKETRKVIGLEDPKREWRILIAEDQLENQLLLQQLLEQAGFKVRIAKDGEETIKLFEEWHPQFIWMDRRMPRLGGLEATLKIRELPGGKEVKIATLTASVFKEQKDEVMAAGSDDFVRKPFHPEEIFDCMARLLGVGYHYEDKEQDSAAVTATLSPEQLAALPAELHDALENAVTVLDVDEIRTVVKEIATIDAELAATLSQRVEQFDFSAIRRLLTSNEDNE